MQEKIKIFGGPGCGKTTIIKDFYQKYLLNGYQANKITVLTFRKNAANDLIAATIAAAKTNEKELKQHVGTIHSICYRLIGYPETMEASDYKKFIEVNHYEPFYVRDIVNETHIPQMYTDVELICRFAQNNLMRG